MKKPTYTLFNTIILLLIWVNSFGQTTLYTESFEADGFDSNYIMNRFYDNGQDYFGVVNSWGNTQYITSNAINPFYAEMTNLDGIHCISAEDLKKTGNPLNTNEGDFRGYFITKTINVVNYQNLEVRILLGARGCTSSNVFEENDNDAIRIQYAFDNDIANGGNNLAPGLTNESTVNTGSYTDIGRFLANSAGELQQDTNLNGNPDGTSLTNSLTEYIFSIPTTGTNLSIRVHMDYDDSSEEVAFDNIRILGNSNTASNHEENFKSNIKFYPNPTNGRSTILLGKTFSKIQVKVTNVLSQSISYQSYKSTKKIEGFEIKGKKGVYFIHLNADGNKFSFKIIKK